MRTAQLGNGARLAQEARPKVAFIRFELGKLNGHAPAQVRIFRQIHLSHASLGEAFEYAVMRDYLADHLFRFSIVLKENEMTMPQDSESAVTP
jgi:hypothetical protein